MNAFAFVEKGTEGMLHVCARFSNRKTIPNARVDAEKRGRERERAVVVVRVLVACAVLRSSRGWILGEKVLKEQHFCTPKSTGTTTLYYYSFRNDEW